MAACPYCGQKAGWFSGAHDSCVRLAREGCEAVVSDIHSAIIDGKKLSDVKDTLNLIVSKNRIPPDQLHAAFVKGWSLAAEQIALAGPITDAQVGFLTDFYNDANLSAEELVKGNGFRAMTMSNILWHVRHGSVFPIEQDHPFSLASGETLIMKFGSTIYLEDVRTSQRGI